MPAESLRKLHHEAAARIEQQGKFWFATTEMKGQTWFRINPVNIYTRMEHMDALYTQLKQTCREVEQQMNEKTGA
jgi:hypothetical protein